VNRGLDAGLADLASEQHGVFSREQAAELGTSRAMIRRRVDAGVLERIGSGVFVFASAPRTWEMKVSAAVAASGPLAAASHLTAAHLHGFVKRPDAIEVVAPRGGRRRPGYILHQSTDLLADHITVLNQIRTTTIARTIIDVGVPHGIGTTARCIDEARRLGEVDLSEVAELLHSVARKGRNGVGPARRILEERLKWDQVTDSQLEDRFLRLLQRANLPRPVGQYLILNDSGTYVAKVDFAYRDHHLAIELDGAAYHSDPETFRYDRQRQNRVVLQGWTVLRFTYWDVYAGGDWVLDTVAAALARN